MPNLIMETSHKLGVDEAVRRLKEKFDSVRESFGSQVSELREEWDDRVLSFGFKTVGMTISGTVTVEDSSVTLAANLPLAVTLFKGTIQKRIRKELGELLT